MSGQSSPIVSMSLRSPIRHVPNAHGPLASSHHKRRPSLHCPVDRYIIYLVDIIASKYYISYIS